MGIRGERPSGFLMGRRLWLAFGNLRNGGNAGAFYVNGNNALGDLYSLNVQIFVDFSASKLASSSFRALAVNAMELLVT